MCVVTYSMSFYFMYKKKIIFQLFSKLIKIKVHGYHFNLKIKNIIQFKRRIKLNNY